MGTGRKYRKASITRPSKSAGARTRRQSDQKKRLVKLGMDEAVVAKLDPKAVRDLLKRPAKIQASS